MTRPTQAHADPRSAERSKIVKALESGAPLTNEQGWLLLNALESEEANVRELLREAQDTPLQKELRKLAAAAADEKAGCTWQAEAGAENVQTHQTEEELPEWAR